MNKADERRVIVYNCKRRDLNHYQSKWTGYPIDPQSNSELAM
jgi:hypothetical protein